MQQQNLTHYVSQMELGSFDGKFPASKAVDLMQTMTEQEQSFFNAKSLVSFASGVTGQSKQDILDSTLFAQLAANKKYPEQNDTLKWYECFIDVMSKTGWVIEGAEMSSFSSSHDIYEVENVIIDILTTAFGGTYVAVIVKTLSALKGLSDTNAKIRAFEKNTHSQSKGAFQVGLAVEQNDTVSLNLGTFMINTSTQIKTILFFKSSKDKVELKYCSRKATLNPAIYNSIRETISAKLGDQLSNYVTEIDI